MRLHALVCALLVLSVCLCSSVVLGQESGGAGDRLRENFQQIRPTGQFNYYALVGVIVSVFVVAGLLWFLQLVVAKILVFVAPLLAGLGAAFYVPMAGDVEAWIFPAFAFVILGVGISLVFMLYASIWDLKCKTKDLEAAIASSRPTPPWAT